MQIEWKEIDSMSGGGPYASHPSSIWRAKIFGGWLVFAENGVGEGAGLTFVPDLDHVWDGNSN
ncbi:MAG TPA: hypothetical protein VE377_24975 [Candidatus Dormibacteraeota bacterium]|nr:hypothetical protein [Candidatus Dormibacteraeota bacterium]